MTGTSVHIKWLMLILAVLLAITGMSAFSVRATAANSDLAEALKKYGTFGLEKNLLSVESYENFALSNGDGLDNSLFLYENGTLTLSDKSTDGGTVRISNDLIEVGTVTAADGEQYCLAELPMLYAAKVTFDTVDSVAWHGGGLAFGWNESGYAVTFRAMVNGSATFNMKSAESNYDWNATDISMAGYATATSVCYDLAVVRNGLNYQFFINGHSVGFVNLPPSQDGKSNRLKKAFFGVNTTPGCKIIVEDMRLIPLADIPDYELNSPSAAQNCLNADTVVFAYNDQAISHRIESIVKDGLLWQKKADSEWKYDSVEERDFATLLRFRAEITKVGTDSRFTIRLREREARFSAVRLTFQNIVFFDEVSENIKTVEFAAPINGVCEIVILSAPYHATIWIDGTKEASVSFEKTDEDGNVILPQSNTCIFTAEKIGVNITNLSKQYTANVLFEKPNRYPENTVKGEVNLQENILIENPNVNKKLFAVLLSFGILYIALPVCAAVGFGIRKYCKNRKNKS